MALMGKERELVMATSDERNHLTYPRSSPDRSPSLQRRLGPFRTFESYGTRYIRRHLPLQNLVTVSSVSYLNRHHRQDLLEPQFPASDMKAESSSPSPVYKSTSPSHPSSGRLFGPFETTLIKYGSLLLVSLYTANLDTRNKGYIWPLRLLFQTCLFLCPESNCHLHVSVLMFLTM